MKKIVISLAIIGAFALPMVARPIQAQTILQNVSCINATQVVNGVTINTGCNVNDFDELVRGMLNWGLGISGALALLFYIIGGLWMLYSRGNSSRVERGKEILIGTTSGIFFILASWLLINFVLEAVQVKNIGLQNSGVNSAGICKGKAANTTCGQKMVCNNVGSCVSQCEFFRAAEAARGNNFPWACHQSISECGITVCAGETNCKTDFCSGDTPNVNVCCYSVTP